MRRALGLLAVAIGVVLMTSSAASAGGPEPADHGGRHDRDVRFATFNASLNRPAAGQLRRELEAAVAAGDAPAGSQLRNVLEIVRAVEPDV
jgi:hypothetical protein